MKNRSASMIGVCATLLIVACGNHSGDVVVSKVAADLEDPGAFGWRISSLEAEAIEPTRLMDMLSEIRDKPDIGISSVLIVHEGALVLEEYFGEWGPDDLHTTRSASKAITSALAGIAIDQGFLSGVDQKVIPFFPEYDGAVANWDERKNDINIGHLLSMTSGVRGNEDEMYPTDDWVKFYLDQPLAASPGDQFSYATSGVVVLGSVIMRASGKRIPEFTDDYLFGPLGVDDYRWPITNSRGSQGLAMTGGGLNLTPRDMAKFGLLYLNKGRWEGNQIISSEWVEASTTRHSTSDLYGEDFGYLWRMIEREIDGQSLRSFEAWGNGGQFIMVFPSLNLVAVWTGENYGKFPEMERPFELMDKFVLPTFLED